MARRSPQSAVKRAREQALREKREQKQAKKDARAAERRRADAPAAMSDANGNRIRRQPTTRRLRTTRTTNRIRRQRTNDALSGAAFVEGSAERR